MMLKQFLWEFTVGLDGTSGEVRLGVHAMQHSLLLWSPKSLRLNSFLAYNFVQGWWGGRGASAPCQPSRCVWGGPQTLITPLTRPLRRFASKALRATSKDAPI